jgi:UDP-N-acetylglucosamine 3-dehydrogenase
MARMRIGLVGGGNIGRVHASAYRTIEGVDLIGIADADPLTRAEAERRFGAPTCATLDDLLAGGCDVVDVCLPTPGHRAAVEAALAAGVRHVFVEKPLARTVADGRAMLAAAERAGATLYVGHVVRFTPAFQALREAVLRGDVGTAAVVRTARGGPHPPGPWFADHAQSGGVLVDMLVHDFDWLRWTFGEVERVYCRVAGLTGRVDYALATLRLRSGAIAHVEGSWAQGRFGTAVEVAGDAGLLRHDSRETEPLAFDLLPDEAPDGPAWREHPDFVGAGAPHARELAHFVACARDGRTPLITGEDALAALQVAEAALEAAHTGQPVALG